MAKEKIVTVEIDADGGSSVDLDGFDGQGCEGVLRAFQGTDEEVEVTRKPDYYTRPLVNKPNLKNRS